MLVPNGLKVGDTVIAGPSAEARVGNALPLSSIPLGTTIHNIELVPGKGGQIVRSRRHLRPAAGQGRRLRPGAHALAARSVGSTCAAWPPSARSATSITRTRASARPAARDTWASRPEVRGVVMNPRDHPHGGGEGKSPTGMPPKTPWGQPAMGHRTRRNKTTGQIHRSLPAPQELAEE